MFRTLDMWQIKGDNGFHVYTLHVKPDNTFDIYIDTDAVSTGNLLEDFSPAVNPDMEIDDPEDEQPEDWVTTVSDRTYVRTSSSERDFWSITYVDYWCVVNGWSWIWGGFFFVYGGYYTTSTVFRIWFANSIMQSVKSESKAERSTVGVMKTNREAKLKFVNTQYLRAPGSWLLYSFF